MKRLILFLVVMSICAMVKAQDELDPPVATTTKLLHLHGPVMWLKESEFLMIPREGELKPKDHPLAYTDTLRLLKAESEYFFNEDGRLKQEQHSDLDEKKGKITSIMARRFHYDQRHELASIVRTKEGDLVDSTEIDRNRKWRIMNLYRYDRKDNRVGRVQYSYDQAGRLITIRDKDKENFMLHMVRISYNENGEEAERMLYGRDIKPISGKEYSSESLDSGKVQYNCFLINSDHQPTGMQGHVLNAMGQPVEVTVADSNRRVTEYRTLAYNPRGHVINEVIFAERKLHISYAYTYDDAGNWIEKKIYHNDAPAAVITREIRYYSSKP